MGGRFLTIALLCLLGMGLGTAYTWVNAQNDQAGSLASLEPAAGVAGGADIGGSFTLTDQNGNTLSSRDIAKYKLVFFGFTYCPDVCPAGLQKMTQAMEALETKDAAKIQPVFITIDPARDTPEVMQVYLKSYHDSFIGLTGSEEDIDAVEKQYKVYAARMDDESAPDGYSMNHSSFIFLMGPNDDLISLFSSTDSPAEIVRDIKNALSHS